jgi:hypothetical protein
VVVLIRLLRAYRLGVNPDPPIGTVEKAIEAGETPPYRPEDEFGVRAV